MVMSIRVGILVIYTGRFWPIWFNTFLLTTQFTMTMYEWIFIVPTDYSPPIIQLPSRVRVEYNYSLDELARHLLTIDPEYQHYSHDKQAQVTDFMKYMILNQPYMLIEFKPTLGHLFRHMLEGYSHWAYADIDMLLGRVDKLITTEILQAYDIVSTSFGDTYVLYMRGQLTIHKNHDYINNIWQHCEHHTNLTNRLLSFHEQGSNIWPFESAEGCYSHAVIMKSNVSILIMTSQLSDAYNGRLELRESFLLGKALVQCYTDPIELKGKTRDQSDQLRVFLREDSYRDSKLHHVSLTSNQSAMTPIHMRRYKCVKLYWFHPKYEMCLDELPVKSDVVRINRAFVYVSDERRYEFDGSCREGAISHMQIWKNNFYTHTCHPPPSNANGLLITDSGLIPYTVPGFEDLTYKHLLRHDHDTLLFGRLKPSHIKAKDELVSFIQSSSKHLITSYCIEYSYDMLRCLCPLYYYQIQVLKHEPISSMDSNLATLIMIARPYDVIDGKIRSILESWSGPIILVVGYVDDISMKWTADALINYPLLSIINVELSCHARNTSSSSYGSRSLPPLPDNMLFNIGLDLADTDVVLLLPIGFHLQLYNASVSNQHNMMSSIVYQNFVKHVGPSQALLYPAYYLDNRDSFPSPSYPYAKHQHSRLRIDYTIASMDSDHDINVFQGDASPADLSRLLRSSTIMTPVAFNISATFHGKGFIRFPEELNGIGCYGTTLMRLLIATGYDLYWGKHIFATVNTHSLSAADKHSDNQVTRDNRCRSADHDRNATLAMMKRFHEYYTRLVAVRNYGFSTMYSKKSYGFLFEKYQSDRVQGRGDPRKRRKHKIPPIVRIT